MHPLKLFPTVHQLLLRTPILYIRTTHHHHSQPKPFSEQISSRFPPSTSQHHYPLPTILIPRPTKPLPLPPLLPTDPNLPIPIPIPTNILPTKHLL